MLGDAPAGRRRRAPGSTAAGIDRGRRRWRIWRARIGAGWCTRSSTRRSTSRDSRGYGYAEVTAGGIPLDEIDPATMQSRVCPGLYLVGEILDVDGRLGGFNFQWAWSSGWVAGHAIAQAVAVDDAGDHAAVAPPSGWCSIARLLPR